VAHRDERRRGLGVALVAGLMGGVGGGSVGAVAGATYGGNYATHFEFAGARGYEATGFIGAAVGFIAMAILCFPVVGRLTRRWSRPA